MNWGNLTSLAEVGIGVNLGFAAIEPLRSALTKRLQDRFELLLVTVQSVASNAPRSVVEASFGRSIRAHLGFSAKAGRVFVCTSLVLAAVHLFALTYATFHSEKIVSHWWACASAALIAGPALLAVFAEWISYLVAHYRIKQVTAFTQALTEMRGSINPTVVSAPTGSIAPAAPSPAQPTAAHQVWAEESETVPLPPRPRNDDPPFSDEETHPR